jgi:hypothetical protein
MRQVGAGEHIPTITFPFPIAHHALESAGPLCDECNNSELRDQTQYRPTLENSVHAKFAEFLFHALG